MCDSLEQRRQRFIEMARERHGDKYDYSLVELVEDRFTHVTIKCPQHGMFRQTHIAHLQKRKNGDGYTGCRKCGNESRPRKRICVDCGCWNKYGGASIRCKNCNKKHKESEKRQRERKYLCRECGEPTGSRDRVYCSSACRVAKNRIVVKCGYCKAEIVKPACQVRRSNRLFCNPECQRLSLVGDGDPQYASKKAKEAWKKKSSTERRLSSEKYKWWRLCNRKHFKPKPIGWASRCKAAVVSLNRRAIPKKQSTPALKPGTWAEAMKKSLSRIAQAIKRQNVCAWTKCCWNKISGLSRRRRIHNERQSRQQNGNKQAINEAN